MNWKEQFKKQAVEINDTRADIRFIETKIIEKLIADIPDSDSAKRETMLNGTMLKQQLRDKWL
jgi:hypothetical protein